MPRSEVHFLRSGFACHLDNLLKVVPRTMESSTSKTFLSRNSRGWRSVYGARTYDAAAGPACEGAANIAVFNEALAVRFAQIRAISSAISHEVSGIGITTSYPDLPIRGQFSRPVWCPYSRRAVNGNFVDERVRAGKVYIPNRHGLLTGLSAH